MACRSLMCIVFSTAATPCSSVCAVAVAAFDAAAGHPHRKALVVVVAAVGVLGRRGAAEFAAPNHQRVFEHVALLEVGKQRGDRLVDGVGVRGQLCCRLLCWSQPSMPSSMNRTPLSANRRARRHCRPKLVGAALADAVGRRAWLAIRDVRSMISGTAPSMRNASSYDSITPSSPGLTWSVSSRSLVQRGQQVELLALQLRA